MERLCYSSLLRILIICIGYSSTFQNDVYPPGILKCQIYETTEMDCSHRYLRNIPELSYNLTTTLDLSHNNLSKITGAPFRKLSQLQVLDLSFNNISIVSPSAFKGLHTLQTLLLMNNSLASLPDDIFSDLSQLIKLDMQMAFGWPQSTIPSRAVAPLCSLQDLVVSGVNFTSLYIDKDFRNLTNLRRLDIGSLSLVSLVTNETFQHLSGLPIEEVFDCVSLERRLRK